MQRRTFGPVCLSDFFDMGLTGNHGLMDLVSRAYIHFW